MKKKILIISETFYPLESPRTFRTTELIKRLVLLGHKVTLLVPEFDIDYSIFEKKFNIRIKSLGKIKCKTFDTSKGPKQVVILKRIINRILNWLFTYPKIEIMFKTRKVLSSESGYDLLVTIAAPHQIHWGTALARSKENTIAKIWVADCGDPFMGTTVDSFRPPFYFKYIEKYWCKKANFISVPFSGAIDGYYSEFHHKIRIIPQGFDLDSDKVDPKKYVKNPIPTFGYAGGLIPGVRDPNPLISYLLNKKIVFKFYLFTNSRSLIIDSDPNFKENVVIENFLPRKDLIEVLSKMDFLVNFENNQSTQLPSKLIDYYICKRPVLSINSFSFNKRVVDEFLVGNYNNRYLYENPEQYNIEIVTNQFLNLIN